MKKKYYFAYGSNCNLDQMAFRCPKATVVGPVTLRNYRLTFNGKNASPYSTAALSAAPTVTWSRRPRR